MRPTLIIPLLTCLAAFAATAEAADPPADPPAVAESAAAPDMLLPEPDPISAPADECPGGKGPDGKCVGPDGREIPPPCGSGANAHCHRCDTHDDGNADSCAWQCDHDGDENEVNEDCFRCNFKGGEDNEHPDACYRCDSDGDGADDTCDFLCETGVAGTRNACFQHYVGEEEDRPKNSCCAAFGLRLRPRMYFRDRSLSRVGVGESGSVDLIRSDDYSIPGVTWSIEDNATAGSVPGGALPSWTAGDRAGSFKICAEVKGGGCKTCLSVSVVEPSGVIIEKAEGTKVLHINQVPSVGFIAKPYITPADVSFRYVQVRERAIKGDGKGYFKKDDGEVHGSRPWNRLGWSHLSWEPAAKGSSVNIFHPAYSGWDHPVPYSDGSLSWQIPWEFRVIRVEGSEAKKFAEVNLVKTIDSTGAMTIQKGIHSETRALDAPSSDY